MRRGVLKKIKMFIVKIIRYISDKLARLIRPSAEQKEIDSRRRDIEALEKRADEEIRKTINTLNFNLGTNFKKDDFLKSMDDPNFTLKL